MSDAKASYNSSLGCLQLPVLTQESHDTLLRKVIYIIGKMLNHVGIGKIQKYKHADIDLFFHNSMEEIRSVVEVFFFGAQTMLNDCCLSVEIDGHQVDFISIQDAPLAELFYSNGLSQYICIMFSGSSFSLSTSEFKIKTSSGSKFTLSMNSFKVCEFLGLHQSVILENLNLMQLFILIARSPFYDPGKISFVRDKDLSRPALADFVKFCKMTPSNGVTQPSVEEAVAFFGQSEAYAVFLVEEEEKARLELIRKEQEKKQAAVKKQISAYIAAKGIKGKEVGILFDSFKEWIRANKRVSYEEWAHTDPAVAETLKEFYPRV